MKVSFDQIFQTYFVNLTDSFKMATVCLLSERWRYITLAVLNLTLTVVKETKKENLERFLSEDSIGEEFFSKNQRIFFAENTNFVV